jgi:hypothetical protein
MLARSCRPRMSVHRSRLGANQKTFARSLFENSESVAIAARRTQATLPAGNSISRSDSRRGLVTVVFAEMPNARLMEHGGVGCRLPSRATCRERDSAIWGR